MRRAGELLGLAVISRTKGEILGEIDDILFEAEHGEIKAIVIKNNEKWYTSVDNIYKIGDDLVVIEQSRLLYKYGVENNKNHASLSSGNNTILGESVITSDGKEIGSVNDLLVDEDRYKMVGYEISGGIFSDLLNGRNMLPIDRGFIRGEDAVILDNDNLKDIK